MARLVLRNSLRADLGYALVPAEDVVLKRHERQEEIECALHSLLKDIGWALAIGDTITVEDSKDG